MQNIYNIYLKVTIQLTDFSFKCLIIVNEKIFKKQ